MAERRQESPASDGAVKKKTPRKGYRLGIENVPLTG